jgi:hypothetical protein
MAADSAGVVVSLNMTGGSLTAAEGVTETPLAEPASGVVRDGCLDGAEATFGADWAVEAGASADPSSDKPEGT